MHDRIEVGLFGAPRNGVPETLYLQKHNIRAGTNRLTIRLAHKPQQAGIDPRHLLIDVEMADNVSRVKEGPQAGS